MRILGVSIANGLSSEARVFAGLLRHRGGAYEPTVYYHGWPGQHRGIQKFADISEADVRPMDFGWRPNSSRTRSLLAKVGSALKFRLILPRLLREARALSPDVIYSNQQAWDCAAATYLAERLGKPQIIHLHYVIGPWLGQQTLDRLKTCAHVVTVSDFIRGLALEYGIPSEKVTTVPNTMPLFPPAAPGTRERLRTEWQIPDDAPIIGQVGRITADKGVGDTIAAFAPVAGRFPAARLLIVGSGLERPDFERQAQESGFGDRILFTGPRNDIPDVLASVDLFAHPSRRDPAPLAILEAMASGLPVVAYAEGGACDFVASGETGFLAPPGDVPALAAAFDALLSDPERARTIGAAARQRCAAHFQPEASGEKLARIIKQTS